MKARTISGVLTNVTVIGVFGSAKGRKPTKEGRAKALEASKRSAELQRKAATEDQESKTTSP